jgi:hypothetical protein
MHLETGMSVRRALVLLALALAAGCTGERHPMSAGTTPTPHLLRWAGSLPPQFIAPQRPGTQNGPDGLHAYLTGGLSLDRNTVTFWAVRGQQRSVQINYLSSTGDTSFPFLQLSITDPVFVPGRGELQPGDSVEITVTIDPSAIKVSLEPTGTQFGDPAHLKISYGGADGDMNGDGIIDATDAQIETHLLGLWYREGSDSAWAQIPASQSVGDKSFFGELHHFSEYAVSFLEYAVSW